MLFQIMDGCLFFQWIDGPEMYDERILLFPHDDEKVPVEEFKRWVPPPPNPPQMTEEEKNEASRRRVANPPLCKCGYRAELERPPRGLNYIPFFRCPIPLTVGDLLGQMLCVVLQPCYIELLVVNWLFLQGNKRGCDFQEWIYGPKSHYPDPDELPDDVLYGKKLPCESSPPLLCQCGVPARRGVVPSELGYGYFCGNTVGEEDDWVSDHDIS